MPLPGALLLPGARDWTFSMSLNVAPKKRRTPMHDLDAYYEDTAGNKIEFGFTATVYMLDPDGQRIRYWDTGLPPAFYRAFATPERGRFVAERLSASGSTLLVIDASGKMYTRMFDYEMYGACPGLKLHVREEEAARRRPTGSSRSSRRCGCCRSRAGASRSGSGRGPSPADAEHQHPPHRQGQRGARAARPGARLGRPLRLLLQADLRATSGSSRPPASSMRPLLARTWGAARVKAGSWSTTTPARSSQPGQPPLSVELLRFYYYDTPATLRVHPGDQTFDLALHTFDGWGPTVQQKEHPSSRRQPYGRAEALGRDAGDPRRPAASEEPEVKRILDTYFRRLHHVHEAFTLTADDARVELITRPIQRRGTGFLDYAVRIPLKAVLSRSSHPEELALYAETNFTHLTEAGELVVAELSTLTAQDAPRLATALARNEALLAEIRRSRGTAS